MTQPPYVPPRDDDSTAPVWPATQEPTYSEASYVEPVSSVAVGGTYSDDQGQSTKDVAKDQAGNVKDTAVEQGQQVAGVAKEQAGAVKDTALEQGQHVAEVAKEQVSEVASEATAHVKDLLSEGLSEIRSQAGSQQKRAATAIHSLADELGTMASKSDKSGPLTDYAKELSRRGGEAAHWLENAEPSEVLDSLRSFARRRPGLFLASSALAGVVVGRLTRGFVANKQDEKQPQLDSSYSTAPGYATTTDYATTDYGSTPGYATTDYTTTGYSTTPQYTVESGAETPYSQDVPATGTGYTTDAPEYGVGDPARPYGTTGNDGVTR